MKTQRILILFLGIVIAGVLLAFSTWRQWNDNQKTTLERMKPIPPIAEFNHGASIRKIVFDPKNPELIACTGAGNIVKVWNINNQDAPQLTLEAQKDDDGSTNMIGIAFSPTDNWIASKTFWTLEIWDVTSGSRINRLHIPSSEFAISPEGKNIVMDTDNLTLWDIRDPKNIKANILLPPKMGWESLSLEGLERTYTNDEKSILRLNIPTEYHNASVNQDYNAISFSHDGKWIAAGGKMHDGTKGKSSSKLKIWDLHNQQLFRIIERDDPKNLEHKRKGKKVPSFTLPPSNDIRSIQFSPDNRFFGLAADNGLTIWSLPEWKIYHEVLDERIFDIAFSPDGMMFAVTDIKGITLWSVETLTPIALLQKVGLIGSSVIEFSPDGNTLAGGGFGGVLSLWDLRELNEP